MSTDGASAFVKTRESDADSFKDSLARASAGKAEGGKPYLGDQQVVLDLLQDAVLEVVNASDQKTLEEKFYQQTRRLARIFVGADQSYAPIVGWNEPGGKLPAKAAEWVGSTEESPAKRLEHLFVELFGEVFKIAELASNGAMLDEQTAFQYVDVIKRYAWMLLGVGPAAQLGLYDPQYSKGPEQDE